MPSAEEIALINSFLGNLTANGLLDGDTVFDLSQPGGLRGLRRIPPPDCGE